MIENASSIEKAFGTNEFGMLPANFSLIAFSEKFPQGKIT